MALCNITLSRNKNMDSLAEGHIVRDTKYKIFVFNVICVAIVEDLLAINTSTKFILKANDVR